MVRFANCLEEPAPKLSKLAILAKQRLESKNFEMSKLVPSQIGLGSGSSLPLKPLSKLSLLTKSKGVKKSLLPAINTFKPLQKQLNHKIVTSISSLLLPKSKCDTSSSPIKVDTPQIAEANNDKGIEEKKSSETVDQSKKDSQETKAVLTNPSPLDLLLQILLSVDSSSLLSKPVHQTSITIVAGRKNSLECDFAFRKLQKLAQNIFHAFTNNDPNIAKAKTNFNRPSPDDKVLKAQKQAFELDMKKLSMKDKPAEKSSQIATPLATKTKPFVKIDLTKELAKYMQPHRSFVIIGHVDAGKSTLVGRILYDTGTVDAKTVNRLVREAEKSGKGSFALAWLMDQTTEERSRGVTIDICSTSFKTDKMALTAIDAPGHKDFVPQMISGVSQADIALLVVDSINGEFEAGFVMDGQTKEHTLLVKSLGIEQVCIAINKLDKENWSQARFEDIRSQLLLYLTSADIGFKEANLHFIPISGITGLNVVKRECSPASFEWYAGPTLIECLQKIPAADTASLTLTQLSSEECNLSINEIVDILSSEFRVHGKLSLGMLQAGETVRIHPTGDCLQVQAITVLGKQEPLAVCGQIVLLSFRTHQLKNKLTDDLAIGDLVLSLDSVIRLVRSFEASITTFRMDMPLLLGAPFVLFRHNASVAARISKILSIKNSKRTKMHLVSQQEALVIIETTEDRLFPVAKFSNSKALGRVVLRKEGITIAAGTVQNTEV